MSHVDLVADLLTGLINAPTLSEHERLGREVLDVVRGEWEANDAFHRQALEDADDGYLNLPTENDEVPV